MKEQLCVCDERGNATVIGEGKAYFLLTNKAAAPEVCVAEKPLQW